MIKIPILIRIENVSAWRLGDWELFGIWDLVIGV
jgi:hypothetical protein